MSNPNRQKGARATLRIRVKLPPVPRTFALDTPGVESRISIADVPAKELERIAAQWVAELLAEARRIQQERES